jgi:hypothetical protein
MHLCDDAERHETHLGAISCYQFENFEKVFGQVSFDATDGSYRHMLDTYGILFSIFS